MLLGNLAGGTLLVAGLNHLQVRKELQPLLPRVQGKGAVAAPRRERPA